jgi:hypothetical protein
MIVSSFVKDSSAYECGQVRDGGKLLVEMNFSVPVRKQLSQKPDALRGCADILSAVDGQNVEGLPLDRIHGLLLGEKDSWVRPEAPLLAVDGPQV